LPFDRKVEVLLEGRSDVAPIVRPMLVAWRQLRVQIAAFDKAIRAMVRMSGASRLDECAWRRPTISARLCEHRRRSVAFCPITIGRRAPWAHATTISIGRGRSKRPDIQVRRHPDSNADV
jgi:hypothetical protein